MSDATPASAPAPASPYDVAVAMLSSYGAGSYRETDWTGASGPMRSAELFLVADDAAQRLVALMHRLPLASGPFLTASPTYAVISVSRPLAPDEIRALAELEAERAAS
jgi:hypothetical protein